VEEWGVCGWVDVGGVGWGRQLVHAVFMQRRLCSLNEISLFFISRDLTSVCLWC